MSTFRVDGLASGLQTSDMIEQLIAIERRPITLLQEKKSTVQLKKSAWGDVASRVENLKSTLSSLLQYKAIAGNKAKVSSTGTSPLPLAATAEANAPAGTWQVVVSRLATGTTARSGAAISRDIVAGDLLDDSNLITPVTKGTFSINGVAFTVDPATQSLQDVMSAINASSAGVTASLTTVNGRQRMQIAANAAGGQIQLGSGADTSNFLAAMKLSAATRSGDAVVGTGALATTKVGETIASSKLATDVTGSGTLTINGVDIAYNADADSLNTVIARINTSSAGVTASYDSISDRFVLQNKQTGGMAIALEDTGGLLGALGVANPAAQTYGQTAEYSLDGGTTKRYSASNTVTDALAGITLTLSGTNTEAVTLTVAPDTDGAMGVVKKFVEQYNSTLSFIQEKIKYDPETKKAGTLLGDGAARSLERQLRGMLIAPATTTDGVFTTLSQVGISFGAAGSALGSTDILKIDETKLKDALQTNAPAVFQLFGAQSTATITTQGDVRAIAGTPTDVKVSGRYEIASDGAGNLTARFIDGNGNTLSTKTATVTASSLNSELIPGLTITTASAFTGGTTTIAVGYQQGVMSSLDQYLKDALEDDGLLTAKSDTADKEIKTLDDSIKRLEDRLTDKEQRLVTQFARVERLIAQMQSQSAALSSQLSSLASMWDAS